VCIYIQIEDILGKVENTKIYIESNKYLRRKIGKKRKGKGRNLFLKNHTTTKLLEMENGFLSQFAISDSLSSFISLSLSLFPSSF